MRDYFYIIDHSYKGVLFDKPTIITQKEHRIIFKENHPVFKTDVYYYTDNNSQVDVFYHAVTLKLIGNKEKQKDYIFIDKTIFYLKNLLHGITNIIIFQRF